MKKRARFSSTQIRSCGAIWLPRTRNPGIALFIHSKTLIWNENLFERVLISLIWSSRDNLTVVRNRNGTEIGLIWSENYLGGLLISFDFQKGSLANDA